MINIRNTAIAAFVCISVAGCITPKYKSPTSMATNDMYRGITTSDTTSIAQLKWNEYYSDIHLNELISEALDSNLNLRIAIKQIDQAHEYFRKSKAAIAPQFGAGVQYTATTPSDFGAQVVPEGIKTPVQQANFSINASWEIDIWGKLRSAKQVAYSKMLSQVATKNTVITELVSGVASSYYQLLMLDAQLRVTEKTIQSYTEYLSTVETMKNSAQTNEIAVQQAKAQLLGAQAKLPQIKAAIEVTENYVSILLGKTPGAIKRTDNISIEAIQFNPQTGIPAGLLSNRPDVIAAENNLRASHWQFNQARASLYPSLTLSGQVGSESLDIQKWFDPKSIFWSVVGGLTQPLFNARALRTERNVAKLQNESSLLSFKNQLLTAGVEVSNSILQIRHSTESALIQKEQVTALENAYDYSQQLFTRGYATYLDVLVAQTGLFQSELNLYQSYYDVLNYKIELYRSLGGGWK